MRDLRIEVMDDGSGIYIAVDPDGRWFRTSEIDELITLDWDAQGRLIGIEVAGSTARTALDGLFSAITTAKPKDDRAWAAVLEELVESGRSKKRSRAPTRAETAPAGPSPRRPSKRRVLGERTRSTRRRKR